MHLHLHLHFSSDQTPGRLCNALMHVSRNASTVEAPALMLQKKRKIRI